ncbi:unnamed protein product [Clonostachys rosea f. rosea IK726]|uniref:Uncharacterized protein n=1 Tax=Clonostachys rosea f. rosea IK726 TaxID=1349383 RepID=A0ACA9TA65_BIOOC|nr:unnamed protein product [Clonostachys rosea f. rosea IK726]
MSADLFAEFNQLSSGPPPAQQQQQQSQQAPQNSSSAFQGAQSTSQVQDSFDFFQSSNPPTYQQSQQSQQSSSGLNTWNTSFAPTAQQPHQPSSGLDTWNSSFAPAAQTYKSQEPVDDDDGWGDFEVAESEAVKPSPVSWATPSQSMQAAPPPPPPEKPVNTNRIRASTMDIMTNNLVDLGMSQHRTATATPTSATRRERVMPKQKFAPSDPNVLFDADDFELQVVEQDEDDENEDDDDFGDFESVTTAKPSEKPKQPQAVPPPTLPSMDLLSLGDSPMTASTQSQERPSVSAKAAPKQAARSKPSISSQPRKAAARPAAASKGGKATNTTINEEEEWAAWDDFESSSSTRNKPGPAATKLQSPTDNWEWGADDTFPEATDTNSGVASMISAISQSDNDPPPTNVPPPSVILSAFPSLLASGNSLFKPLVGQNISIKQRILSDPKAIEFLKGYILLATTAGHVIAGRKHRWHRDKILAKSMSISAAGSKGMKLAGVDKTQAVREDREAADIAGAWRDLVGRVRSAVAAANGEGLASLKVPELSDTLQVQTAKFVPTGTSPCIICGLKREERVNKVDHDVEDSFGEWWVDHWGHRACKNFWVEHEKMLRQR